ETDLPDRAGKTRACLTAGPNQPEHKKTDTPIKTTPQRHTPVVSNQRIQNSPFKNQTSGIPLTSN
ncbi:hypothetical protein, partial [Pseudomonas syringae]|uniref:hypothetical protein n=1 Tax=Pseudomonas syringae TaxID=317 RepID=UPI001FFB6F60